MLLVVAVVLAGAGLIFILREAEAPATPRKEASPLTSIAKTISVNETAFTKAGFPEPYLVIHYLKVSEKSVIYKEMLFYTGMGFDKITSNWQKYSEVMIKKLLLRTKNYDVHLLNIRVSRVP